MLHAEVHGDKRVLVGIHACTPPPMAGREDTLTAPPLVFVHGLYHAAWCWEEHWMGWLAGQGYSCYAVSLRGQVTRWPTHVSQVACWHLPASQVACWPTTVS